MKAYRAIAEYYDPEYDQYDWLGQDVPFYLAKMPQKSRRVLELAAGTGRAAVPIAQAGHKVVGIDFAKDVLAIAKKKKDVARLTDKQLDLRIGDATNLDDCLNPNEKFDSIAIFFNTFLNFTTLALQDQLLAGIRKRLRKDGHFWLDVFQPNLAILAQQFSTDLDPYVFYVPSLDRTVYKTTEVRCDPATQVQNVTFHYRWFDPRGNEKKIKRQFDLTFMFPRELHLLIERHGMKIDGFWGDYDASPVQADSPRMIARCKLA